MYGGGINNCLTQNLTGKKPLHIDSLVQDPHVLAMGLQ